VIKNAILKASLDAVIVMDHEGCFVEFNPAAEAMFGFSHDEVVGKPLADFIVPERLRESHRAGLARYLATRSGPVVNQHVELPALRANGEEFPVEIAIVPVEESEPPLFAGFLRDITERKREEQRRQFVTDELAHRGKNLLAVVHAVASRTLAEGRPVEQARDLLLRRLGALARSQAALVADGFEGVAIADIVRMELEGFAGNLEANGPEVKLKPRAAQTLSLIVHELATNAAKHGALSRDGGRVVLQWQVDGDDDAARLKLRWQEQDGPPVSTPSRLGFGRMLLEQVAAHDFETQPVITFASSGLIYELDAPLAAVLADGAGLGVKLGTGD
jgi:PAS domain S-box-containing protein